MRQACRMYCVFAAAQAAREKKSWRNSRKSESKRLSIQIMLSQQTLEGPTLFAGSFGGVGDVSLMRGEKFRQITALEGLNRTGLRFPQRLRTGGFVTVT